MDNQYGSYDIPENDEYNGIKIFEKTENYLKEVCTIKNAQWFPSDIYWITEKSFIIKAANKNIFFRVTIL